MELQQFASNKGIPQSQLKKICSDLFGTIPGTLDDSQITQIEAHLAGNTVAPQQGKLAAFKPDSTAIRKRPQATASIILSEDYQKLYSLVPVQFQAQLDKLPEADRVGVLLAAIQGIEAAEVKFLTSQSFENARLTQLQNAQNVSNLSAARTRSNQMDDFADFDVSEFIQKLEAEELLKAMIGG
jgi:hypothetical protein